MNKREKNIFKTLVVDDEQSICDALEGVLSDEGWQVAVAKNGKDAIAKYNKDRPDLVLLDVWMPGMDGIETLQKLKEIDAEVPIVIMSGHGSIGTAVRATKLGAFDYLEKPLSLDKLIPMLEHAIELKTLKEQKSSLKDGQEIIGQSELITQIKRQISIVAPRNAWVLITGENGTGKEVIARNIHKLSPRSKKPFVAVNCAAIPEQLIESELFGHVKGAFTNALANKMGKFELANQGTLFLDEIGDMSLQTQAKILRILQEQSFEKIGGTDAIKVDVRVIAATNKDLRQEIGKGNFREDLFYRLNVIPFHLPPLRERQSDILLLTDYFLSRISVELGEKKKTLAPEAEKHFLNFRWPGNVRELKNTLERLCIMVSSDVIHLEDLELSAEQRQGNLESVSMISDAATLKEAKNDFEKSFIIGKLEEHGWNVTKTAEAIGLERTHLHRKLKSYGIDPKQLKG
jgi:two-component system nitrogen regulation response regulator NtrX